MSRTTTVNTVTMAPKEKKPVKTKAGGAAKVEKAAPADVAQPKKRAASEIDDIFAKKDKAVEPSATVNPPTDSNSTLAPASKKKKKNKGTAGASASSAPGASTAEIVDHSSTTAPSKPSVPMPADDFANSRGSGRRKIDGLDLYSAEELGLVKDRKGGDTPLCPFDCPTDCCS